MQLHRKAKTHRRGCSTGRLEPESSRQYSTYAIMQARSSERAAYLRATEEGVARADTSIDTEKALATLRRHQEVIDDSHLRVPLTPHTCSYCQAFIIDNSGPQTRQDGWIHPKLITFRHITLVHVKEGAQNQCTLCQSIVEQLDRDHSSFENDRDEDLTCFATAYHGQGGEFDLEGLDPIGVWNVDRPWTKWANKTSTNKASGENWMYECVASEQDPASNLNTTRPINIDPADDESFKLMRSWLAECRYSHHACQHFTTQFRPFRLLEISGASGSPQVRLCEVADGPLVDYTTLSYCWGGPQPAQTTTANIEERKEVINLESLPRTIRHAILVTQRLRIPYIWIDSLCILQDSPADKIHQIASMPRIFQNSTLTISTTRALYAAEGFLRRKPTDHQNLAFSLPYLLPSNGQLGSLTLFRPSPELSDTALTDRGWTLQEFALSPRVLDFGGGQTRWICTRYHVDGWLRHGGLRQEWRVRGSIMDMVLGNLTSRAGSLFTRAEGCKFWEDLVSQYTRRALSVATDRALAIAGLAEVCCGHVGWREQYMAGLWRSMYPWALLWSMPHRQRGRLPRPVEYQGPSWSWTAVNGAVHFGIGQKLGGGSINLAVLDCSTELEDEGAPFGAVTSGALVVEGKTLRAKWLRPSTTESSANRMDYDSLELAEVPPGGEGAVALRVCPDAQEADWEDAATEAIDIVLLEVGYEPAQHLGSHAALGFVLRELEDGFYSRLGIFETSTGPKARTQRDESSVEEAEEIWKRYRDIFGDCEREVLVIV